MTGNLALEAAPTAGERPACLDFFARETNGTHVSPPPDRREGLAVRRSRARLAGRLTFSPIDNVANHTRLDSPATNVPLTPSRPEVLADGIACAARCPDIFTSDNVRIRFRPEVLTQEVARRPEFPDFFASENVRANSQNVHFCAPTAAKTDGAKTQFPTGRKFAKKIFIQFPAGRNFCKNPLDISNMVII